MKKNFLRNFMFGRSKYKQKFDTRSDQMKSGAFIEVRTKHTKRRWLKIISFFVAFVFLLQQISYAWEYRPATVSVPQQQLKSHIEDTIKDKPAEDEIEITNYDVLKYKGRQGSEGLLEKEKATGYAPSYLKRQQSKHEDIIKQRQGTEDLMLLINKKGQAKEYKEDIPLKRRKSSGPSKAVYFTMEDYDGKGNPRQLNAYVYEGGKSTGRMKELVSYDISHLEVGAWTGSVEKISPKEGDPFMGSYKQLTHKDLLTDDRIITRTVYSGEKGKERIDFVLSRYDEKGIPKGVTLYDYDKKDGKSNLDETRTYNVANLEIDFELSDWKTNLTEDRLTQTAVYEGAKDKEKIVHTLDTYLIGDDEDENTPNRISIYDYSKTKDGNLDEVRSYYITDIPKENWLNEQEHRLESVTIYEGEKDKEKMKYMFSSYFEEEGRFKPWERKDYTYEGKVLKETKTYDISEVGIEEGLVEGSGSLDEYSFFIGEKGHEKLDYSYALYDEENAPQIRTDYIYDARTMSSVETYDIADKALGSKDQIQEESIYEGKSGEERITSSTGYYPEGEILKTTLYNYAQNERGVYYADTIEEKSFSPEGNEAGRMVTINTLRYIDRYGREKQDKNGNIREQNTKTYYRDKGIEKLYREDDVILSLYTAKGQAGKEERLSYIHTDDGQKITTEYSETKNHAFNPKGRAIRQTIQNYKFDDSGSAVYDNTTERENRKFDYYGNAIEMVETLWLDQVVRSDATLLLKKIVRNEFDNRVARRRGNPTKTEVVRYDSLEETLENRIDRTVTTTSLFDNRGYAVDQESDVYVTDSSGTEKLTSRRLTHNENIDSRGDSELQEITTYRTDQTGLESSLEEVSYQVFQNRGFDPYHNTLNQKVMTYDEEGGMLLDVQEIRALGYHTSGVAIRQEIATYADENEEELLDVKIIDNSSISANGNVGKTTITKYTDCVVADNGTGSISCSGPIDRQSITTKEFDVRGNALEQTMMREYYDEAVSEFVFSETQKIMNSGFDIHDRTGKSLIESYKDEEFEEFLELQEINYIGYDRYGNALKQTVDTYSTKTARPETLIDHKSVVNEYDDVVSQRRGNATRTEVNRYNSLDETSANKIDRIVTETQLFNEKGYAVDQTTDTYVVDTNGVEKLTSQRITHNEDINNRGDAARQEITTYRTDQTGSDPEVVNYQIFTNREYDSEHNAKNQMVMTYDKEGGILLDTQEIRSLGFHSSGTAVRQIISTYTDENREELLDVKVIENADIAANGNVGKTTVSKYNSCSIADDGSGEISYTDPIDRQTITTGEFDLRGNALDQSIIREYYDEDKDAIVFSEAQKITNSGFDIHDRTGSSIIESYKDMEFTEFLEMQEINYVEYDRYNNALEQTIDTYTQQTPTSDSLVDHKRITNEYDNILSQRRGNPTITEVNRYDSLNESSGSKIDRILTKIQLFNDKGYAVDQTTDTYVVDAAGVERLTSQRITHNEDINNRGDSAIQEITTYKTDQSGSNPEVVSYQVFNNREYDSEHNIKNQTVLTYDKEDGLLLDAQEIRSIGYHTSGVALRQVVATYSDEDKEELLDVKIMENLDIAANGNIGTTVITKYDECSIEDDGAGTISYAGPIDKQTVVTEEFDLRGNALEQSIIRSYYDEDKGEFTFSEAQKITNSNFDIHDRTGTSTILSYNDTDFSDFIERQDIGYVAYDRYSNALEQTIETYSTEVPSSDTLIDHKRIVNEYDDIVSQRRGNATRTVINRYSSLDETIDNKIDKIITTTTLFNNKGYAVDQNSDTYVVDADNNEKLTTRRTTHNANINSRGDAEAQEITTYRTDETGDEASLEEVSYQVFSNREYDSEHNIKNQEILTYDEKDGSLLDAQEIRSIGYHTSGVALRQVVATYLDEDKEALLDVKVIENAEIAANGNVGTSTVTKYDDCSILDDGTGAITYTDPIDRQTVTTEKFDDRGNALKQSIMREYYNEDEGNFSFSEAQKTTNSNFDIHDRTGRSQILNYKDTEFTDFTEMQDIEYVAYDRYSNALEQVINTYSAETAMDSALIDHKRIVNEYDDIVSRRRGNATTTEINRYSSLDETMENKIDRTVTVTTLFDTKGYAVDQRTDTYAVDSDNTEKLTSRRVMHNGEINSRGDSESQEIITYRTDETGTEASLEEVSYQLFSNRQHDSDHNIKNQMILTYDEKGGDLLDVQEIRSKGYHTSGVAAMQIIATYADKNKDEFLDVKVIENTDIQANGNVGTSTITKYEDCSVTDDGTGEIEYTDPIDRQTVTTNEFDLRGNALEQSIIREYYNEDSLDFAFSESQKVSNSGFDIHDRTGSSVIKNYKDAAFTDFTEMQEIDYVAYDRYNNALEQTIDTYTSEVVNPDALVDHKRIVNQYANIIAQRRGNDDRTEVTRYNSLEEIIENKIDKTITTTSLFDSRGQAIDQVSNTFVFDPNGAEKLTSRRLTHNENMNNRGDAETQAITTFRTDETGSEASLEEVNHQVFTNREHDSEHNVTNQTILTYDEKGGVLLDAQEIRSVGYHTSGVASRQVIATYTDEGKEDLLDVKVVENAEIAPNGNVGKSTVTKYANCVIGDDGEGEIGYADPIDRQTVTTSEFDLRGNAVQQSILREYYNEDRAEFSFSEAQIVNNSGFDIHDRTGKSVIKNYKDAAFSDFVEMQEINYVAYDRYSNAIEQTIDAYASETASTDTLVDHKRIVNEYEDILAQRRGNATESIVIRYDSLDETIQNQIEKTITETMLFDNLGHAIDQRSDTYVVDPSGEEKMTSRRLTHNENINNRGDAETQEITTLRTDKTGAESSLEEVSHQIFTNREHDSEHNVTNQTILTYEEKSGILLDAQEIRSKGYHTSGVAAMQVIATYADIDKNDLLDVKVVENTKIASNGDVGESVVIKYADCVIADEGKGDILYEMPIDKQTVTTDQFDLRGNAMEQSIIREYYDENIAEFVFSESQKITNSGFDIHDRTGRSVIQNYKDDAFSDFVEMQEINYVEYDRYSNALEQTIDTYTSKTADSSSLVDHKRIVNGYEDVISQRRGNATTTEVTRYNSLDETIEHKVDRVLTTTSSFDLRGNAVDQSSDTYVSDADGDEKLTSRRVTYNGDITNRGDAKTQEVTTYRTDETGTEASLVAVSYQVFDNREYDAEHNAKNQMVKTYNQKDGSLLDIQEIRSIGYHTSGAALKQVIATFSDEERTSLLDVKIVENSDIATNGNIGTTSIIKYNDCTIAEEGIGDIACTGPLDKQTVMIAIQFGPTTARESLMLL